MPLTNRSVNTIIKSSKGIDSITNKLQEFSPVMKKDLEVNSILQVPSAAVLTLLFADFNVVGQSIDSNVSFDNIEFILSSTTFVPNQTVSVNGNVGVPVFTLDASNNVIAQSVNSSGLFENVVFTLDASINTVGQIVDSDTVFAIEERIATASINVVSQIVSSTTGTGLPQYTANSSTNVISQTISSEGIGGAMPIFADINVISQTINSTATAEVPVFTLDASNNVIIQTLTSTGLFENIVFTIDASNNIVSKILSSDGIFEPSNPIANASINVIGQAIDSTASTGTPSYDASSDVNVISKVISGAAVYQDFTTQSLFLTDDITTFNYPTSSPTKYLMKDTVTGPVVELDESKSLAPSGAFNIQIQASPSAYPIAKASSAQFTFKVESTLLTSNVNKEIAVDYNLQRVSSAGTILQSSNTQRLSGQFGYAVRELAFTMDTSGWVSTDRLILRTIIRNLQTDGFNKTVIHRMRVDNINTSLIQKIITEKSMSVDIGIISQSINSDGAFGIQVRTADVDINVISQTITSDITSTVPVFTLDASINTITQTVEGYTPTFTIDSSITKSVAAISGSGTYEPSNPVAQSNTNVISQTVSGSAIFEPDRLTIENAVYSGNSLAMVASIEFAKDLVFSKDSSKVFLLESDLNNNASLFEYASPDPDDITTWSFSAFSPLSVSSVVGGGNQVNGIEKSPDGSKLFIVTTTSNKIHQFNLANANDISTLTSDGLSLDLTSIEQSPIDFVFSPDGSRAFVVGNFNDRIKQFNVGDPNDITTWVQTSSVLDMSSLDSGFNSIKMSNDGGTVIVMGTNNTKTLFQINTNSSPNNINSWTIDTGKTLFLGNEATFVSGIELSTNESRLITCDASSAFYQYNIPAPPPMYIGTVNLNIITQVISSNATFINGADAISNINVIGQTVDSTGTFVELWTPSVVSTSIWYDAADLDTLTADASDNLSQWDDKSGNTNHATQVTSTDQPKISVNTLGGKNVVTFTEDFMTSNNRLTNLKAVILVGNNFAGGNLSALVTPIIGSDQPALADENDYVFVRTGDDPYDISIDGSESNQGNASTNGNTLVSGGDIETGLSIAEKASSNIWYFDYNNTQTTRYIGALDNTAQFHKLNGDIAEIILLDYVPSAPDRERFEGYLAHKWGLTANLQVDHPYKNNAPRVTWTPNELTTALWYDADDSNTITVDGSSNVTQWNDKSGNDRNLTPNSVGEETTVLSAGLNGKDVMDFNNSKLVGTSASLHSGNWTAVAVVKHDVAVAGNVSILAQDEGAAFPRVAQYLRYSADTLQSVAFTHSGGNIAAASAVSSNDSILDWNIAIGRYFSESNEIRTDGALDQTATLSGTNATGSTPISVGRTVTNTYMDGQIAELILVPTDLATTDVEKLEGYLAHKWGLTANLPVDHPYKNAAPTVVDWTPNELTNSVGWYDYSDGSSLTLSGSEITVVEDKSGNGNDFTPSFAGSGPDLLNNNIDGKDVANFDGSTHAIQTASNPFTGTGSVFTVFIPTDATYMIISDGLAGWIAHQDANTTSIYNQFGGTPTYYDTGNVISPANRDTLHDAFNNTLSICEYVDVDFAGHTRIEVSAYGGLGNGWNMQAKVAEMIFVDGVLSTSDREKIEGYLAHKWGITSLLPAAHPYKNNPPLV